MLETILLFLFGLIVVCMVLAVAVFWRWFYKISRKDCENAN